MVKTEPREVTLLRASVKMLEKAKDYVFGETVHYDEADCDVNCLIEDINNQLEEIDQK